LADLRTIAGLPPHPDNLVNRSGLSLDLNEWANRRLNTPSAEPPLLMRVLVPALPAAASNNALPTSPAAPSAQAAQRDARTFRTTTTAVFVDVSVRRNNRPVSGLTAADFEVLDNGVPQTVDDVTVEPLPLDVSIVIDTANIVLVVGGGVVHDPFAEAARRLADLLGALRPEDRVRIIEANVRSVELLPWTPMRDLAGRALALNWIQPRHARLAAAICDATAAALMHPTPVHRRSLVVVLTDGIDGVSLTTTAELARVAQQSDGTVILVRNETDHERRVGARMARGARGSPPLDNENESLLWPKDIVGFERAVRDSAGYVFNVRDSTMSAVRVREVLADFGTRYVLRYTPRDVPPDGWHLLTVRMTRPGNFNIHARRGYFGG
jgi:VWFA-related protein